MTGSVSSPSPEGASAPGPAPRLRWRTVDIVVAATVAAAFGVVFWLWNVTFAAVSGLFLVFPPSQGLMMGVWLIPAVLGPLIVRRPGAAVFTELVAAAVSVLFGSASGLAILLLGLLQGAGAEAVFAATRYRSWRPLTAVCAGVAAGITTTTYGLVMNYPTWPIAWMLGYYAVIGLSAALIAGLGSWYLVRGLAQAGALASFPSARTHLDRR
ncbi:ECF transporter S component [Allonocardiopsis opalescens]|uniref:Energy-coupling factor transport system substrate-specific component n=1 Tax=Allonocardiopsis opalescens TaxID=1144618 RepID=A0A2T0PXF9_9ACTN|nr:ECF transporter S component [Allonocardiopsis opalescens]PRX96219.1 energy-coupling factor transport system substrate-specific component [Allonocardiopsis opalescens]